MKSNQRPIRAEDPFSPGVYLTDGSSLFNVVGALPHEPSLRLVEDCSTLEILMVHVDGLRAPGVRRVHAMPLEELGENESESETPSCLPETQQTETALTRGARR